MFETMSLWQYTNTHFNLDLVLACYKDLLKTVYTKHSNSTRSCTYNESSYLSSISLVTGLPPAEEPREPGVEFRDKGLGTRGGKFISWSESFIRKWSRESVSLPSTVWLESAENSRPLFGRLELEWRFCRSDGSPLLWPVAKKKNTCCENFKSLR